MLKPWLRLMQEAGEAEAGGGSPSEPGEAHPGDAPTSHEGEHARWYDGLPDDLKQSAMVTSQSDLESYVRHAINRDQYAANAIRVPSEHASDEDRQVFYDKLKQHAPHLVEYDPTNEESRDSLYRQLGRPDDPSGYQLPEVQAPEGVTLGAGEAEAFRAIAHKYGLSNRQFQGIVSDITAGRITNARRSVEAQTEGMAALKREWGFAFDEKRQAAIAAAESTGAPESLVQALKDDKAGAETWRWLAKVHGSIGRQGAHTPDADSERDRGMMTPAEAKQQIAEIRSNREHPFHHQGHPDHKWAVNRVRDLTVLSMGPEGREDAFVSQVDEPMSHEFRRHGFKKSTKKMYGQKGVLGQNKDLGTLVRNMM